MHLTGDYAVLYNRLLATIPQQRLIHDELRTLAFGTDASFYRLIPKIVVVVEDESEVIAVLRESERLKLPVTFRAAGTSLSGQAISDSVLVVLGPSWVKYSIGEAASTITLQPGVVGAHANRYLAQYGKKIGPDPASINSAMIGGIAANNSSGMCCGTAQNSYRTLSSMRIVFADGTTLDTADPISKARFRDSKRELISRIIGLAQRITANRQLAERIRQKYKMKNTTGYSLNAFVDYQDPIEIIEHLMIGSEGTLGFISEITYHTVPEFAHKASSLIMFPNIETACKSIEIVKGCKVDAAELMDRASLRSVEEKQGMPEYLKTLGVNVAALLIETRAESKEQLDVHIQEIEKAVSVLPTILPVSFTSVLSEYTRLWNIRKGLFPSVGAMRATGTTCLIEDVAFPIPRLGEATVDLQGLFRKYGYSDAILFGHALDGNLHVVFNQDFNVSAEVDRYARFIDDLTRMVVNTYDGSLKAEHGTGRNMAPFVELEWGVEAYDIMKEIKRAFDPENLLNPDVIINMDKGAHLKYLKPLPECHPLVDKCIECGFCEVQCPSKNLTLTPRHRIVTFREISRLSHAGLEPSRLAELRRNYDYFGNQTCATDGLCALACPVGIDTGKLTKDLRFRTHSRFANRVADLVANNMNAVTSGLRMSLNIADFAHSVLGTAVMKNLSGLGRKASRNTLPLWNKYLPRGGEKIVLDRAAQGKRDLPVVYFPTCINRTMGISRDYDEQQSVPRKTHELLRKAGYSVVYPENLSDLCCGMAFDSKGFREQGQRKAKELEGALLKASDNGKLPIYVDMSPCLYRMKEVLDTRLRLYEPIEFALTFLVDRLEFHKVQETVAIHSTCSSTKMGLTESFKKLAEMCAEEVIVPEGVGCCGWAGDRGFTYPELNESALANLRKGIPDRCQHGYSTSRTCEIGLSLHGGISYTSIVYLIDKCTTPRNS